MPAKSKAQQKFMGMVHAAQTGEKPASKAVAKVAKDMPKKAAKDFASTKHRGLPAKVKEATDTVEKDEKGNVKSWKHEGDWKKSPAKQGRGKVTNLSDKARRKTEKMSKAEKEMSEAFELALEDGPDKWAPIDRKTPQAAQDAEYGRRLQWYRDNKPDAFNTMQPNDMVKFQMRKGEKTTPMVSPDEGPTTNVRAKKLKEAQDVIKKLEKMISEAKAKKCNHTAEGKKCPVHGIKECGSMYEGNDGNLANNAKPYDKVTKGDVVAGRLGKDEMGEKAKKKKVKEGWTHDSLASKLFENDEYDDEAGMADNNLETLKRAVDGIDSVIQTGDNLPEWCQEKIAVAKSMLVTVWDYMLSEKESEKSVKISSEDEYMESLRQQLNQLKG